MDGQHRVPNGITLLVRSFVLFSACAAKAGDTDPPSVVTAGVEGQLAAASMAATGIDGGTTPSGSASAQAAGAGGGSGLAGTATAVAPATTSSKPHEDLDPNVEFDWTETSPGSTANEDCRPGLCSGLFDCAFVPEPALLGDLRFTMEVAGPTSLTLVPSMNGEFFEISNGSLDAVAQSLFGFHLDLLGQLDRKSFELKAMTQNGMWALGAPSMPIAPGGDFGADISGTLDRKRSMLSGDWAFVTGTVPGACTGTWTQVAHHG